MVGNRVASRRERANQILALNPARRHHFPPPRRHRQIALAYRARLSRAQAGGGARPLRRTWVARLPPPRDAVHRSLRIPDLRAGGRFPPQDLVAPGRSRHLRYPTVTDSEAPPLRPERHIPNSIATVRRRLIAALVSKLPQCPCCAAPITRNIRRKIS